MLNTVQVVEGTKSIAAAVTPEALTATPNLVRTVLIKARSGNAGTVRFGFSSTNGSQVFPLLPTEWISLPAIDGKMYNLGSIYVDVDNAGDAVDYVGIA